MMQIWTVQSDGIEEDRRSLIERTPCLPAFAVALRGSHSNII